MRRIIISPQARRDLIGIRDYISQHNPQAADRLIERIRWAMMMLARLPGIGHRRSDVHDSRYRFWTVHPYLIAYRFDEAMMAVDRILHGARDIREHFKGG